MFFLPENTSINSVVVEGDRRSVRFLNDIRISRTRTSSSPTPEGPASNDAETRETPPPSTADPGAAYTPRDRAPAASSTVAGNVGQERGRRAPMSVRFLSEEWAAALKEALNADEAFRSAAADTSARIQQVITQDGDQETRY